MSLICSPQLRYLPAVEAGNKAAADKLDWARRVLSAGKFSVPSTIAEVSKNNTCSSAPICVNCACKDIAALLASVRTVDEICPVDLD